MLQHVVRHAINLPVVFSTSGDNSSTTHSGISGGNLTLTDNTKQTTLTGKNATETVAALNRKVATGTDTSNALGNTFNPQEIQTAFTVTQAFGGQVGTFMANRASETAEAQKKLAGELNKPENQRNQTIINQANKTLSENATWDMGGTGRTLLTAITAAASGNVTGGASQMVQAAAVNYLQSLGVQQIKKIADTFKNADGSTNHTSETIRTALQGLAACAGAAAQGSQCGSAAMGASASVVLNNLMGGDPGKMTATEKENRKNLVASLVTGIAATAGTSNIAAAANAAAMETANNYLNLADIDKFNKELSDCNARNCSVADKRAIAEKWKAVSDQKQIQFIDELVATGSNPNPKALYYVWTVPSLTSISDSVIQDIVNSIDSQNKTVKWTEVSESAAMLFGGVGGALPNRAGSIAKKGVDLNLKYKSDWTATQKVAADSKCQGLCDSNTVVTKVQRSGTSAASRYRRAGKIVPPGSDVDHVHDLQLGGSDTLPNMLPLNSSVNRSIGSQIHHQIKNLPVGTVINKADSGMKCNFE